MPAFALHTEFGATLRPVLQRPSLHPERFCEVTMDGPLQTARAPGSCSIDQVHMMKNVATGRWDYLAQVRDVYAPGPTVIALTQSEAEAIVGLPSGVLREPPQEGALANVRQPPHEIDLRGRARYDLPHGVARHRSQEMESERAAAMLGGMRHRLEKPESRGPQFMRGLIHEGGRMLRSALGMERSARTVPNPLPPQAVPARLGAPPVATATTPLPPPAPPARVPSAHAPGVIPRP